MNRSVRKIAVLRSAVSKETQHLIKRQPPIPSPAARCEMLENRLMFNAGGGFTGAGISGEYFNNTTLSGTPAFTRSDVRVDFTTNSLPPGGSPNDINYASVGSTNFSAEWNGTIIPKYSETYTFTTQSIDGVKLIVNGQTIINDWTQHSLTTDTGTIKFNAGTSYNIQLQYFHDTGPWDVQLFWQSNGPSPFAQEPIEAATPVGLNYNDVGDMTANLTNSATTPAWYATDNGANDTVQTGSHGMNTVPVDANYWPEANFFYSPWDSGSSHGGETFTLNFKGSAEIGLYGPEGWQTGGAYFLVGTTHYNGIIPDGVGYSTATGYSTVQVVILPGDDDGVLDFCFVETSRDGNTTDPENNGLTNLTMMAPTTQGGSTDYPVGTLFSNQALALSSQFTTLRYMEIDGALDGPAVNWSGESTPAYPFWYQGNGVPPEVLVAFANETGKDMWINVPPKASDAFVTSLADTILYGANASGTPYTSAQSNPVWAPLNTNLRIYVEYGNENWNYGLNDAANPVACDTLATEAIYDYLNPGDGDPNAGLYNSVNDGSYLSSRGIAITMVTAPTAGLWVAPNGTTWTTTAGAANAWAAIRAVDVSNDFRSVYGNADMPGPLDRTIGGPVVRPLLEWQAGDAAGTEAAYLPSLNGYNGEPANYYFYGGGGDWYETVNNDNPTNNLNDTSATTVTAVFASGLSPIDTTPTDIGFALTYGLVNVGYEGGFTVTSGDWHEHPLWDAVDANPSTTTYTEDALNSYYALAGSNSLPVVFDTASWNWGVGFANDSVGISLTTPKLAGYTAVQSALPPAASSSSYVTPPGIGPACTWEVGAGHIWTTVFNTSSSGTYSVGFEDQNDSSVSQMVNFYVDGTLYGTNVLVPAYTGGGYTWTTSAYLTAGLHSLSFITTQASGNAHDIELGIFSRTLPTGIADPSFENPALLALGTLADPTGTPWTYTGLAGIQANGSSWNAAPAPDGSQTAYLESNGTTGSTITQTLTLPAGFGLGVYQLAFEAAQGAGYGIDPLQVSVDGTAVGSPITPSSTSFGYYTTPAFTITTTGTHTITFASTSTSGLDVSFLDNVALIQPLADSGFSAVNVSGANPDGHTGYWVDPEYDQLFTTQRTPWNFSASSGIESNGSALGAANAPGSDTQAAFVQGTGSISQSIWLAPGTYAVSYEAAKRSADGVNSNPIQLSVDGLSYGIGVAPTSTSFAAYTSASFTITTAGYHLIQLGGTDNSGNNYTTFLDSVTVGVALQAADRFAYTSGTSLNGDSGGAGWVGNWTVGGTNDGQITSAGLSYPSNAAVATPPSGNAVKLTGTTSTNALDYRQFAPTSAPVSTGTLYVSFLMNRADTNLRTTALSLMSGGSSGTEELGIGYAGSTTINPNKDLGFYYNGGNSYAASTTVAAANTTYLMVAAITFNGANSTVNLYINPGPTLPTTPSASAVVSGVAAGLDTIRLFAGGATSVTTAATYDEIRLGTTYAQVVPQPLLNVANDSFVSDSLTDGTLSQQSSAGGYGWSGGWVDPSDSSGNYAIDGTITEPNLVSPVSGFSSGNATLLTGAATQNPANAYATNAVDFRLLSSPIATTSGTTEFVSVLVQRNDTAAQSALLSLYNGSTIPNLNTSTSANAGDAIDIGENGSTWGIQANSGANGTYNTGGSGTWQASTVSAANKNTVLMVVQLNYNGGSGHDSAELYVNPTSTLTSSAQSTVSLTGLSLPQIQALRLFAGGNTAGSSGATGMYIDNITVANTFAGAVSGS